NCPKQFFRRVCAVSTDLNNEGSMPTSNNCGCKHRYFHSAQHLNKLGTVRHNPTAREIQALYASAHEQGSHDVQAKLLVHLHRGFPDLLLSMVQPVVHRLSDTHIRAHVLVSYREVCVSPTDKLSQ